MPDTTVVPSAGGPEGYRLLDLLGRGGFGEVWRAEAPGGVKVAVKILSLALKPAEAKRELAALNSMLELRHPYLLSLQAIFYHGDRIFVVMELAECSLRSRLNACRKQGQRGVPTAELLRYLREAAEAIDFLHANQRLHRDIKPDNILLVAKHTKVADYGLARILEQQQTVQTQSVLGTPAYMPPETWEGSVGPRSDQYSLAASYVELRCGRRPFVAQSMPHMARLHATADPDLGGIPAAERPVLAKALGKKSDDRYPTCLAFVKALVKAVQAGAPAPTVPVAAPAIPPARIEEVPPSTTEPPASANQSGRTRLPEMSQSTRTRPVAVPAGEGRKKAAAPGKKVNGPAVAAVLSVLVCGLCGGLTYVAWPKSGPDTSRAAGGDALGGDWKPASDTTKLPPGGSLTGGDLAEVPITNGVKMKFCWVPPGTATLGSPSTEKDRSDDEAEHPFTTKGFWLAKYPVTQEEWRALMKANPSPSYFKPEQDDIKKAGITDTSRFPVENVSWNDCQDFLKALNAGVKVPAAMGRGKFVLPHEDEWEYACRGGRGNRLPFYFGDSLNGDKANCDGTSPYGTETKGPYKERTTQVGEYEKEAPHPWKLCDMHGNVWQWCENKYSDDKDSRVLRGGSWGGNARYCRAADRDRLAPGYRNTYCGFRPCLRLD
ncbi:MAG TPA: bifunctional serine/threonine-protein kinase/formylglycine-generating enzyme family protein [Gemmataceae bacterium]|nr:bifunctional serine/threonine-protein kinase/formylglycine-generating enzyme family protein [Gemmataceae bacterium]